MTKPVQPIIPRARLFPDRAPDQSADGELRLSKLDSFSDPIPLYISSSQVEVGRSSLGRRPAHLSRSHKP
jgi:hypothetical protein